MKYTLEIQKLLYQINDNKSLTPKDKVKMYKQAADIADANDDIEWGYDVRVKLIQECFALASGNELLTEFTWLMNAYENHPDWFDENDFLWQYKWVLGELYNNPDVSMEQIRNVMEDFKSRLERNGFSLQPYYDRLFDENTLLENFAEAKKYLDLRNNAPDDDMGNCPSCLLDNEIDYLLAIGKFDEACTRVQPLIDKLISCSHVPARTYCSIMYYADKLERKEEAVRFFDYAEEAMKQIIEDNDESMCSSVGKMICHLFRAGEEQKGWDYFEASLLWYFESNGQLQFEYAVAVWEGLLKLSTEIVNLELPTNFALYNKECVYRVDDLRNHFKSEAESLATAFDKRNNSDVFIKRLKGNM